MCTVSKVGTWPIWSVLDFLIPDIKAFSMQTGVVATDMNKEAGWQAGWL